MTVPKHKRKQSKLEFMHNYYKIRDQMTFVLMNDFGYSRSKAEARISHKYFHNVPRAELPEPEKILFDEYLERSDRVFAEFVVSEREFLLEKLRQLGSNLTSANGIYVTIIEEANERRLLQDRAITDCYTIITEFNSVLRALPVSATKYSGVSLLLAKEISLVKGWRQSDNKRRKQVLATALSDSASSFANANGNGNANCNNASNTNGVRPDFEQSAHLAINSAAD